jgi:5-methylcytosine-specific restriction protein A
MRVSVRLPDDGPSDASDTVVRVATRNPPWPVDEIFLALDLYFRHGQLDDTDTEVIELSGMLNALPIHAGAEYETTFRNPNSVAMKLANFAALDPAYPGTGPSSVGRRDREIWDAYADRRVECHRLAQAIRTGVQSGVLPPQPEDDEEGAVEGRLLYCMHRARERNPSLARRRKTKTREQHGELRCEVCGLAESDTAARFGELVGDVFECHHTKPLHTLTGTVKTTIADLAIVCPTCHRALHRIEPPLTVAALRERVGAAA